MNPILRNVLSVVAGIIVGGVVNIALVNLGPMIVPLPEGADISTMEGLAESMKIFKPVNFLFPFLAHALGTLVGAWIAVRLAVSHKAMIGLGIGAFFLLGGIMMVMQLPAPMWFEAFDLIAAYLPMGWLGARLATK